MIRRDVEEFEVVEIAFDLAAVEYLEAHLGEDCRDLTQNLRRRMQASEADRKARQGDVDLLTRHRGREPALLQRFYSRVEGVFQRFFDFV